MSPGGRSTSVESVCHVHRPLLICKTQKKRGEIREKCCWNFFLGWISWIQLNPQQVKQTEGLEFSHRTWSISLTHCKNSPRMAFQEAIFWRYEKYPTQIGWSKIHHKSSTCDENPMSWMQSSGQKQSNGMITALALWWFPKEMVLASSSFLYPAPIEKLGAKLLCFTAYEHARVPWVWLPGVCENRAHRKWLRIKLRFIALSLPGSAVRLCVLFFTSWQDWKQGLFLCWCVTWCCLLG